MASAVDSIVAPFFLDLELHMALSLLLESSLVFLVLLEPLELLLVLVLADRLRLVRVPFPIKKTSQVLYGRQTKRGTKKREPEKKDEV